MLQGERELNSDHILTIDGLRSLAIAAVLIFHADKTLLPSGYLGVDLFFVISGFVVTRSLAIRNVSYGRFLAARFYRLAPAAAATVLLTFAVFSVTSADLLSIEHKVTGSAAVIALSNFYLMFQNSYFDSAVQGNPFLHFWSLSVEEQFYLVWPYKIELLFH